MYNLTREEKRKNWDEAIAIAKLDGGMPSKDMLQWIEDEIDGKIDKEDILVLLNEKYKKA